MLFLSVKLAKTAGFCFGVKRAVEKTYELAQKNNKKIVTYGPIIHNEQVVEDLKKNGVNVAESLDEIEKGSLVIIRAHGVSKKVYDYFDKNNIEYVDLTCPFVKKIHNIVKENFEKGKTIVLVGKKNHPEVIGINGWCDEKAIVIYEENYEELENIFKDKDNLCVVAQTTINKQKFYNYVKFLKNTCKTIEVFDTICNATYERQSEAVLLAKEADVMIVVGGKNSSNSNELYLKCKEVLDDTYMIETKEQLDVSLFKNKKIAITAGASTPAYIIKEVLNIMSEEKIMPMGEENFADMLENYLNSSLHSGQIIKGTVDRVSSNEVNINIPGYKGVGVISLDNLSDDSQFKPEEHFKVGDEIEAMVIKKNDVEGTVLLSKKKVDSHKNSEILRAAFESKEILTGKVIDVNKGGVTVSVNSCKIFVPNSLATERMSDDKNLLLNTEVSLKIIEFDERKRRAIGSIKAVLDEERKKVQEAFWAEVSEGKVYEGIVKSLTNFGAFVDLGGVDGLVHISELSWGRIKHPSEVVALGDKITVFVKEIDNEKKKISLGFKKAEDNPWVKIEKDFKVDDVIKCKIVRLVPFGAFAEIIPFVDGLIHISQISNKRIEKVADVLNVGDEVEAKIIEIDMEAKKISLSIRALLKEEPAETVEEATEEAVEETVEETTEE
ncbi:MAG: bifunctional 4-hydroxy-3-methylbut-2-enyl diphosphate reductase/30S ribosomal protein S1 [Ruminococcaceae bacterium]|nr:bifunctional 4-hydroxy-3-methylbut-2-enyl diphosphate reductase/30S ribosomal protein S1 [Oscillospiraceae bacterium]